jgi:CheY-like chemotaxis protein
MNRNKTILVVEDDADQLELIKLHLLNAGYMVRGVANGLEAAASCLQITPDLVISDVHMPRMSGFDMMRILKSEPAMKDIPVIFLTVDEGARSEGEDLGAVEYLAKPFKPAALLMLVGKYLNAKKRGAPQPKAS